MAQAAPPTAESDQMRVIMCLRFDRRAPPEDIKEFKQRINECPHVLHSEDVSGTFDLIFEAAVVDLGFYHQQLENIAVPLQKLVERYEANFVCRRYAKPQLESQHDEHPEAEIWVPCSDGRRRIPADDISRITADGDYVRLHLDGSDCLFHCTIKEMLHRLDPEEFLHIHRSTIVRRSLVERLVHEGRHWKVRLKDGTSWPVSKTHEREVVTTFTTIQPDRENTGNGGPTYAGSEESDVDLTIHRGSDSGPDEKGGRSPFQGNVRH